MTSPLPILEAAQMAGDFIDDYLFTQHGFALNDDLASFQLEFQEVRKKDDDTILIVFAIQPTEDMDNPKPELKALTKKTLDTLLVAHPELQSFKLEVEYMS